MKKRIRTLGVAIAFLVAFAGFSQNVCAEGSVSVSADKETCEIGENITVTIKAEADAASTLPPQLSVEFNSNRLSFVNCSTEYGGGGGGLVTINDTDAIIEFTTLSGGNATVDVTAVLDEDSTDVQKASVTIAVNGEDTVGEDVAGGTQETGVAEGSIDTGDGRVIQAVFPEEFMPVLFHKSTANYQGQTVECASFDMGDMTLLYTSDATGNDGKFCMYNQTTGELSDFRMIQGIENRFIIVLPECEGDTPAGYTKAVLDWNGQTLTAYMNMDAANGTVSAFGGLSASDFFLVYGLSSEGTKGWYQYDQKEGTYQRFLGLAVGAAGQDGDNAESDGQSKGSDTTFLDEYLSGKAQMIILFVLLGLTFVLLVIVIILAVKCSEYNSYDYIDPEEYYADEYPSNHSSNGMKASSYVQQSMSEDDEDEDEDEDEDDEASDDESEQVASSDEAEEDERPRVRRKNVYEDMARADASSGYYEGEEDEIEDYFDPRLSKKELKAREKELRRQEKEAAREEKWRMKEEKKAEKMRRKGYEEAEPMDWSTFSESRDNGPDDRRPMGKDTMPSYMREEEEETQETRKPSSKSQAAPQREVEEDERPREDKLPPRTVSQETSELWEAESAKALKEEELRKKQKRLYEQQQRLEEQRRIEEEQQAEARKREQEQYMASQQQPDEDLDEDFQFEFLNI